MKKKRERRTVSEPVENNMFSLLPYDILGQIAFKLRYLDILRFMLVSKDIYKKFRGKEEGALFITRDFVLSLVRREIAMIASDINFFQLYGKQQLDEIKNSKIDEKFYQIAHIVAQNKIDLYPQALADLEAYMDFYEAKFLFSHIMRELPGEYVYEPDDRIARALAISSFFYLHVPSLQTALNLINCALKFQHYFTSNHILDLIQFLIEEKNKNKENKRTVLYTQVVEQISNLEKKHPSNILNSAFFRNLNRVQMPINKPMSKLVELVVDFFPDIKDAIEKLRWDEQSKTLQVFSRTYGDQLLIQLNRHSLLSDCFDLQDITILQELLPPARHWVFEVYESLALKELSALDRYIRPSYSLEMLGLKRETCFAYLNNDDFRKLAIEEQKPSLTTVYINYFIKNHLALSQRYGFEGKMTTEFRNTVKDLVFISLLDRIDVLEKLSVLFNKKLALMIMKSKSQQVIDMIIDKYTRFPKLTELNLSLSMKDTSDVFDYLEKISDNAITSLLDYVKLQGITTWQKLKPYTKLVIIRLHGIESENNENGYVTRIMNKFPLSKIESFKRIQLFVIIEYFSHTHLFELLSGQQLISLQDTILARMVSLTNPEFQTLVVKELLKHFGDKKTKINLQLIEKIIEKIKLETNMSEQSKNSDAENLSTEQRKTMPERSVGQFISTDFQALMRNFLIGTTNANPNPNPNLKTMVQPLTKALIQRNTIFQSTKSETTSQKRKPEEQLQKNDDQENKKHKPDDNDQDEPKPPSPK